MFNYINDSIFKFEAQSFMLDYEVALRKSLRTCFPEVVLKGCWFHYCQAIRRNIMIRFKSLMPLIRDNKTLRLCYHKLLALPLLPADAILNVFEKTESEIKSCVGNKSFDTFFEYFKKQWLEKVIGILLYFISSHTQIILLPDWTGKHLCLQGGLENNLVSRSI